MKAPYFIIPVTVMITFSMEYFFFHKSRTDKIENDNADLEKQIERRDLEWNC
jgi:hypothetical protein